MQQEAGLPSALAERARAYLAGNAGPVPEARASATIVLLREGGSGRETYLEAYLLRRVAAMAFAAGMYVFPGGGVDARDADDAVPWAGPSPWMWAPRLSASPNLTQALVCAAVRETFEESGVLLAGPAPAVGVVPDTTAPAVVPDTTGPHWEADRRDLLDRSLAFSDLLDRRNLVLRADLVRPWAHWITPEFEPRRYDTRFFVAALPPGQRARDVGGEADRVAWVRPADALAAYEAGSMPMLPPTVETLRELSAYRAVDAVLAAAEGRQIRPLLPRAVLDGDELRLVLPGETGYPS